MLAKRQSDDRIIKTWRGFLKLSAFKEKYGVKLFDDYINLIPKAVESRSAVPLQGLTKPFLKPLSEIFPCILGDALGGTCEELKISLNQTPPDFHLFMEGLTENLFKRISKFEKIGLMFFLDCDRLYAEQGASVRAKKEFSAILKEKMNDPLRETRYYFNLRHLSNIAIAGRLDIAKLERQLDILTYSIRTKCSLKQATKYINEKYESDSLADTRNVVTDLQKAKNILESVEKGSFPGLERKRRESPLIRGAKQIAKSYQLSRPNV